LEKRLQEQENKLKFFLKTKLDSITKTVKEGSNKVSDLEATSEQVLEFLKKLSEYLRQVKQTQGNL
jgi:pantothenate synthetase